MSGRLTHTGGAQPSSHLVPVSRYEAPAYGHHDPSEPVIGESWLDLHEYWSIISKRRWLILGITAACLSVAALVTLMRQPLYTSSVRLQIDRNVARIIDGGTAIPVEGTDAEFLKTQYELLKSRSLAERVASSLRLGDDEHFLASRDNSLSKTLRLLTTSGDSRTGRESRSDRDAAAAKIVLENRNVRPLPGSRLVDLTYTDPDPKRAQRITAALASAFGDSNLDRRFQENSYAKAFLEDQVVQLKQRLEESEKQLLAFAEREQIVAASEKTSIAESNLAGANAALGELVSERIKSEQVWRQVEHAEAADLPQMLSNTVIEGLRNDRNALSAEYEQNLETFKPSYPAMVQIKNRIAELDRQLVREAATVRSSLKASYESAKSQEEEMKRRIDQLRATALDLQKRSIRYNTLKREVETNRSLYEGLLQRQREVQVASGVGTNNVFVVDRAQVPDAPSSPRLGTTLLLALFLGLGVSTAGAILLEHLDQTVRSADDLEHHIGLAMLGVIPKVRMDSPAERDLGDPRSPLAEAYRSLCTALQFANASGLPHSIVVTSAGPAEGKSVTSLAIARHFASSGLKVLIIDADMRNPSLHAKIGQTNATGLSTYLAGACNPPQAFLPTQIPTLAFMPSGPVPASPAELLGSDKLRSLLSVGRDVFDLIVIDCPPVMGLADAALAANAAEATLFVVGAGDSRTTQIRATIRRLQMSQANLVGAVLTKVEANDNSYGYGYGYGQAYGNDDKPVVAQLIDARG
jgi:capsular exopolysaccharide synthesis family protein